MHLPTPILLHLARLTKPTKENPRTLRDLRNWISKVDKKSWRMNPLTTPVIPIKR
uniref:Uncharacterized protein n=1 Tax=Lepeophtheirus salmonis TaxID=72036 RepID=A0A0K2UWU7_LEPSM